MKKYLITVSAAAFFVSANAKAADIVTYQPEVLPIIPAFTWAGFYAGGQLGGTWGNAKTRIGPKKKSTGNKPAADMPKLPTINNKLKPQGFLGGLFAGYNFQTNDRMVLGIETDFAWDNVDDSKKKWRRRAGDIVAGDKDDTDIKQKVGVKQKWIGATRLRAGYSFDRVMPYVAVGLAYTKIEGLYMEKVRTGKDKKKGDHKSNTRTGITAGVGVDYMPPVMNDHIILRAEYRYSDFGKKKYNLPADMRYRVKYNQSDFRVGVAYKF